MESELMDLYEEIIAELRDRNLAKVETYPPYFISSVGAHLFNLVNRDNEILFEHGQVQDYRLHLMHVAPSGFCLARDSKILCSDGYKQAKDVEVGDKVADRHGEFTRVVDKWGSKRECLEIKTSHPTRKLVCSPEHRVLVRPEVTGNSSESCKEWAEPMWMEAGEIEKGDRLCLIPEVEVDEVVTDWTDEMVKFLAFWIAEGRISQADSKRNRSIIFASKNEEYIEEMEKCVDEIGGCHLYDNGRGEYRVTNGNVGGRINKVREWIQDKLQLSTGARNKYIPEEVFHLPRRQRELFWQWLWNGGGSKSNNTLTYSTSSERLKNDVQRLLLTLGKKSSVYEDHTGNYRVLVSESQHPKVQEITNVGKKDTVDFETESGSLNAEQIVVHNSKSFWQRQFLKGPLSILGERLNKQPVETFTQQIMTEASFTGTVRNVGGSIEEKPGIAKREKESIIGVGEFDAVSKSMDTSHSGNLDNAMLEALDQGHVQKNLSMGELNYRTYLTNWSGTQPTRFNLSQGLGRRFMFMLFIPDSDDIKEFKQKRREGRTSTPNRKRLDRITEGLIDLKEKMVNIEFVEFTDEFYQVLDEHMLMHFEEPLFERLAVGYHLMRDNFDDTVIVGVDDELARLIQQGVEWRNGIARGPHLQQLIQLVKDNEDNTMSLMDARLRLSQFGMSPTESAEIVNECKKLGYIKQDGNKLIAQV